MQGWRALIRLATVTKEGTDDQALPVQQVKAMGKTARPVPVAMPYGLHANVPIGTPGILWRILGQRENRFFTPFSWRLRRKESPVGDLVLYQPQHRTTEVILRANGDVEINTDGNHVEVVEGTMKMTSVGEMTLKASKLTIDAPIEYTGTLTSTSTSVELRDHKHSQDPDGDAPPDSQVDTNEPKN